MSNPAGDPIACLKVGDQDAAQGKPATKQAAVGAGSQCRDQSLWTQRRHALA